jgi:hypothetical protein
MQARSRVLGRSPGVYLALRHLDGEEGGTMGERVAIVGSRDFGKAGPIRAYVDALPAGTIVVSGGARGADRIAAEAAARRGLGLVILGAAWGTCGRSAGVRRNTDLVASADRVVAFWSGRSLGTLDTIKKVLEAGKPLEVYDGAGRRIEGEELDAWIADAEDIRLGRTRDV